MSSIIGLWNTYHRGEVYSALDRLLRYSVKSGFQIKSMFSGVESPIKSAEHLFNQLKDFEKKEGVRKLLDILTSGLELTYEQKGEVRSKTHILLRTPEGKPEDLKAFKSMIANWVENSDLSFMERFFESSQPLFLHTPLERGLKRKFGFRFQYKILVTQEGESK